MGYIYARDCKYKLDNIWGYFTATQCPTLAGKPKLFFIQACQGDQLDAGVTLINRTETDSGDYAMSYKIPIHADFLIAYSTIPGKYWEWNILVVGCKFAEQVQMLVLLWDWFSGAGGSSLIKIWITTLCVNQKIQLSDCSFHRAITLLKISLQYMFFIYRKQNIFIAFTPPRTMSFCCCLCEMLATYIEIKFVNCN